MIFNWLRNNRFERLLVGTFILATAYAVAVPLIAQIADAFARLATAIH